MAGMDETTDPLGADFAIRSAGAGSCHPVLDVACSSETVVITLTSKPSTEAWLAVLDFVGCVTSGQTSRVASRPDWGWEVSSG
jgi:hypothetical protein